MLLEHGAARIESGPERRLIRPALAQQSLQRHGLMGALDLGVVSGTAGPSEADVAPQGQQPQMEMGRKRLRRGVLVKDCSMIEGDAPGQARAEFGASEHELIGLQRGD